MDTIVALATPPGRSAIGVVRMSGPQSVEITRSLLREELFQPEPNQTVLKKLIADSGDVLDYALVSYFKSPHSFTGEDMVEISCHGSPVILRQVLDKILNLDGRLAVPGEFTLRACRNGKMNLSQAEAIRDLINAQTMAAAQQATRQLRGELSSTLQPCKQALIGVIVTLESALEFVEDDLPAVRWVEMQNQLEKALAAVNSLVDSYGSGHLLREGLRVTLLGRPNVGKSSLFNRLLRFERAIVTDLPGTTRDSLTESISLNGIPISLTDTAGMREAGDRIEAIGLERTQRAMADADLLIVVFDASTDLSAEDAAILGQAREAKYIIALNKSDLGTAPEFAFKIAGNANVVHVSALTGEGLDDLTAAILEPFGAVDSEALGFLITDSRHHDLLRRTQSSLAEAIGLMGEDAGEELVLVGLHNALRFLGEITGETTTEDLLTEIFSTFCIGK
jgi:tRNA modification GTPase